MESEFIFLLYLEKCLLTKQFWEKFQRKALVFKLHFGTLYTSKAVFYRNLMRHFQDISEIFQDSLEELKLWQRLTQKKFSSTQLVDNPF